MKGLCGIWGGKSDAEGGQSLKQENGIVYRDSRHNSECGETLYIHLLVLRGHTFIRSFRDYLRTYTIEHVGLQPQIRICMTG